MLLCICLVHCLVAHFCIVTQWGSPSASDPRAKNTGQRATKGTVLTSQSLSPWCDCRRLGSTWASWRLAGYKRRKSAPDGGPYYRYNDNDPVSVWSVSANEIIVLTGIVFKKIHNYSNHIQDRFSVIRPTKSHHLMFHFQNFPGDHAVGLLVGNGPSARRRAWHHFTNFWVLPRIIILYNNYIYIISLIIIFII